MVGAISANSFQLLGQSPCSSANAESLGKWLMAMLCCVVTTVGYFGACVLHSPGNGGTGALSALRYRIAGILDGVCGLLSGVLQGLAGVVYGLARGLDPGGAVLDMQMNVLKL